MLIAFSFIVMNVKCFDERGVFSDGSGGCVPLSAYVGVSRVEAHHKGGIVDLLNELGNGGRGREGKIQKRHILQAYRNTLLPCHRQELTHKFKI